MLAKVNFRWSLLPLIATLLFVLIAPYALTWRFTSGGLHWPVGAAELLWRSLVMSAGTATLALLMGMILVPGALRAQGAWTWALILPAAVPALVPILTWLDLFPGWRGLSAVIFVQGLMNAGLVAVSLARALESRWAGAIELAIAEGAPPRMIWQRALITGLTGEFRQSFLFVFAMALTSFSIPLVLGGRKAVNFEMGVFQSLQLEMNWSAALSLSLMQLTLLIGLVLLLRPRGEEQIQTRARLRELLGRRWSLALGLVPVAAMLGTLLGRAGQGVAQLDATLMRELPRAIFASSFVALGTSVLVGLGLGLLARQLPSERERAWLSAYTTPSAVLLGFATLAVGRGHGFEMDLLRMILGCSLMFAPALWRWRIAPRLAEFDRQIEVARCLGAKDALIAARLVAPGIRNDLAWVGGLAAFWAWGDFALSSVVAGRSQSLALLARDLMQAYRLEAAALCIFLCLLMGILQAALTQKILQRRD
jgi:thiamine transport system permease protein